MALSLPEPDEEGNKMEVEKKVESRIQEECGKESKDNVDCDDAGSEVNGKARREMSDSSKGSKRDILNVPSSTVKSKCIAKGGEQKANLGVANGWGYSCCILSNFSNK
eukprot:3491149-Ditylum_brightwellii.AAC.1